MKSSKMKKAAIVFLFISVGIIGNTQCVCDKANGYRFHDAVGDTNWSEYYSCICYYDTVWNEVPMSKIPEFKGDFNKWISGNITYPLKALDALSLGQVAVTFNVEKDGSISNIQLLRHVAIYLDTMAVKAVSRMPKWKPGIRDSHKVKTSMVLSLRFIIKDIQWHRTNIHKQTIDSVY